MLVPLDSATRTRRIVAELLVVALVAVLLVTAYRIDRQWISRHVTLLNGPPYSDEAWSTGVRGLLVVLAALVVLGLRPALISIVSKGSLAGLARSTAPVLLAIAASAVTVEGFLRWMQPKDLRGGAVYPEYSAPHPRYGWTGPPSSTTTVRVSGRDTLLAFNREGIRVRNQDDEPDPARPTILFTGESIALGFGLAYAETYPALIAERRGVQCVNLAAPAYGNDQAYLRLIDAMPRFEHLVATVTVLIPLQLSRNLYDGRPRLVLGPTGELELRAGGNRLPLTITDPEAALERAALSRGSSDRPDTDPDLGDPPRDEHPDTGPRSDAALRDPQPRSEPAARMNTRRPGSSVTCSCSKRSPSSWWIFRRTSS